MFRDLQPMRACRAVETAPTGCYQSNQDLGTRKFSAENFPVFRPPKFFLNVFF
jgi:hypothetical protein